jgi:hypothetical protein
VTGGQLVNPAGWFRGVRLALNGKSVTMAELADYWARGPAWCCCAPGLGYVCPGHLQAAGADNAGLGDPGPPAAGSGVPGA